MIHGERHWGRRRCYTSSPMRFRRLKTRSSGLSPSTSTSKVLPEEEFFHLLMDEIVANGEGIARAGA